MRPNLTKDGKIIKHVKKNRYSLNDFKVETKLTYKLGLPEKLVPLWFKISLQIMMVI